MKIIIHEKAKNVIKVLSFPEEEVILLNHDLIPAFWELCERYPEELIGWCENDLEKDLDLGQWKKVFHHDLVMSSYAVKSKFLSESIGYVDQMPFINVKGGVKYPTWRMSSDVGGIKGETLLKFQEIFGHISNFDYLLNSIAKVGQQNGLFCYSDPHLIATVRKNKLKPSVENELLLLFVYQHYKSIWFFVLFFCLMKYENRFPVGALFRVLLKRKFFNIDIDLSNIKIDGDTKSATSGNSVDVIIPTLGRAEYVMQVVEDLGLQSLIPERVIIVEQQPDEDAGSELQEFLKKDWPFQIVHLFTHNTGACMARNMALKRIKSEWIFFADDDIRIKREVFSETLKEADRLGVGCINLNCRQPGEEITFHKIKQWGSFGAGTSMVHSRFVKGLWFSEIFEHGYGEDADFGMKLREAGCDIIYHPHLEIQHLKAPLGGFRKKPVLEWEKEDPRPKPSPTVMVLAKKYFTSRQIKGFKISLYFKFFRNQKEKNPFTYLSNMEKSWKKSEEWAKRLERKVAISTETDLYKNK